MADEFTIATIGFAGSGAEHFFGRLRSAGIEHLLDIRLRHRSQLAGFANSRDLPYLLRELCGISYDQDANLAPDDSLIDAWRAKPKNRIDWEEFTRRYLALLEERGEPSPSRLERFRGAKTVLLCSEPDAASCHRGILADRIAERWGCTIEHL